MEVVVSHAPDDGRRVHVAIRNLTGQQFPQDNAVGPDVNLLGAGLVLDHLGGHPGNGSRKTHLGAHLVLPLATGAKVTDLHDTVPANEDAKEREGKRINNQPKGR